LGIRGNKSPLSKAHEVIGEDSPFHKRIHPLSNLCNHPTTQKSKKRIKEIKKIVGERAFPY